MLLDFLTSSSIYCTFGLNNFAPLLQNFSLAFLTILIPVSLAIFQDGDKKDFNRMVIVNKVLKLDDMLIAVLLCFSPTLAWIFFTENWAQIFLFAIWAVGCQKLISIYWINFRWLKGKQEDIKYDYVKNLKKTDGDFISAWEMLWKMEELPQYREKEYIHLFSSTLTNLCEQAEYKMVEKLIDGFAVEVDKRNPMIFLFSDELLKSLFEVHKTSWVRSHELMSADEIDLWGTLEEVNRKTEELINRIFLFGLQKHHSHLFMRRYAEHINSNLALSVGVEDGTTPYMYVDDIIASLMQVLFSDEVSRADTYNFWNHEFPVEWKVTKLGLSGAYSRVVIQILETYIRWVDDELNKENQNFKVDNVTLYLIPEVDPMIWLPLLDFRMHSFGASRVLAMVQRDWKIGLIGRMRTYSGDPPNEDVSNDFRQERLRTYELTYSLGGLFRGLFSQNHLDAYIRELESYTPEDEREASNKSWMLRVFGEMKEFLDTQRAEVV